MYFQVLKVGVTETRYVCLKHCRPWVIHAYRSIKGRGLHKEEEEDDGKLVLQDEGNSSKKIRLQDDVLASVTEGQGTGKRAPTDPSGVKENKSVEDTAIISADDNIVKDTTDKVPDHRSIIDETELDEVQKTLVDKTSINKSSTTDSEESQETLSQKVPFKEIRSDDYQKLQGSDDVAMRRQDAETEIQPGQSHSIKTAASQSDSSQADQSLPRQDVEMETQPSQSLSVKTAASQSNSSQADQSLPERPQPSANWSVASEMARHSSLDEVVTVKARSIKKLKASVEDASIREDQKLKASVDEASIREDKKLKASVDEAPIREDQKLKASVDEASKVTRADKKRKAQADETESPAKIEPEVKSTYDKVRLICQPWRKPEGGVNKPVLKMMLESVMLFLTFSPGSSLKALYHRYTPYLQPMVLKNIVEILEDIGCVTRQYMKPAKVCLFSKPFQGQQVGEDRGDCQILLVPTPESLYRLGQFGLELYPGVEWPKSEEFTL